MIDKLVVSQTVAGVPCAALLLMPEISSNVKCRAGGGGVEVIGTVEIDSRTAVVADPIVGVLEQYFPYKSDVIVNISSDAMARSKPAIAAAVSDHIVNECNIDSGRDIQGDVADSSRAKAARP